MIKPEEYFTQKIKWNNISKYREELFDLAIISIMVFHYFENVALATYVDMTILKIVARIYNASIGSVGVDIFGSSQKVGDRH